MTTFVPAHGDDDPDDDLHRRLFASSLRANQTTPDAAARAGVLARETGVPQDVVERNIDQVDDLAKRRRQQQERERLIRESPRFAKWLADPANYTVAADDLDHLSLFDAHVQATRPGFFRNLGASTAGSLIGGVASGVGAAIETLGETQEPRADLTGPDAQLFRAANRVAKAAGGWLQREGKAMSEFYQPRVSSISQVKAGGYQAADIRDYAAGLFGQGVGSMGAVVAGTLAGGPLGGAATSAVLNYGGVRDELGAAGATGSFKNLVAVGLTIPIAALDIITPGDIAAKLMAKGASQTVVREAAQHGLTRAVATEAVRIGLGESGTEVVQEATQYLGTQVATGQPVDAGTLATRLTDAALGGFLGGFGVGGMSGAPRIREAQRNTAFFTALGEGVKDSKTFARLPDKMQDAVAAMTKDGPVETVYAPIEPFREYFQSVSLDPAQVAEDIFGSRAEYEEAVRTGGDLAIPTARYAVTLAPTEHNAFFAEELRTAPDALNGREAKALSASVAKAEETTTADAAPAEDAVDAVRAAMVEKLVAAGTEPSRAATEAAIYASMTRAVSARLRADPLARIRPDPLELFRRYTLDVSRPSVAPTVLGAEPDERDDQTVSPESRVDRSASGAELFRNLFVGEPLSAEGDRLLGAPPLASMFAHVRRVVLHNPQVLGAIVRAVPVDVVNDLFGSQAAAEDALRNEPMLQNGAALDADLPVSESIDAASPVSLLLGEAARIATEEGFVSLGARLETAEGSSTPGTDEGNGLGQETSYDQERRAVFTIKSNRHYEIKLLPAANLSSFVHETGHFYMEVMTDLAKESPAIAADVALLREWVGADGGAASNQPYERAGTLVDGRTVGSDVPNTSSIESSFDAGEFTVLPGIREVPLAAFENTKMKGNFYAADDVARVKSLAEEIRASGRIDPLIVVMDKDGPYVLEGGHRLVALDMLGAKSLPALVIELEDARYTMPPGPLTREQHEQIARGFESYLMEGKAPSPELRPVFYRMRAWLTWVYRELRNLNVSLTPEVRAVFDRLLATEEEIAAAQAEQGQSMLFPDPAALGMTEAEAAKYREADAEARRVAEEWLAGRLMREVGREQTAVWQSEREKVRAEVAVALNAEPAALAYSVLARGKLPDGSALPDGVEPVKLSKRALAEEYASRYPDLIRRLQRPYLYSAKDTGLHPDDAAALFGFGSGDQLVQALLATEDPRKRIERITDERMAAEHPSLLTSAELPEQAMAAVHSEKRAALLHRELQHLASTDLATLKGLVRKVTRRVPPIAAVRAEAEQAIARKSPRFIRPVVYQRAEATAAKAAVTALLKGDIEAAFAAKERELLNHELYRAARAARDTADSIAAYMATFTKTATRARIGKAGADYLEQIDAITERFDFAPGVSLKALDRRQSLLEFVDAQRTLGIEITVPAHLIDEANRRHWKDVPLEELVGIRDTVKQIAHLARLKNKLLASDRERTLDEARGELVAGIGAHHDLSVVYEDVAGQDRLLAKTKVTLAKGVAEHTRMEFLFRILDGGQANGPVWRHFFKPLADAENVESDYGISDLRAMQGAFGMYTKAEQRAWYTTPVVHIPEARTTVLDGEGAPKVRLNGDFTKPMLLSVLLNSGNQYNREAMMEAYGWNEKTLQAILGRLDERDGQFAQAVWDHIATYQQPAFALHREMTGLEPEAVDATPISGTFGQLRGGYYPVSFDRDLSSQVAQLDSQQALAQAFGGGGASAMTAHGHTIARTNTGGKPLRLDLDVIGEHLAQVRHDIAFRRAVVDVNKMVRDPEIQTAIERAVGREMYKQLDPWLRAIAGDRVRGNSIEGVAGWLRQRGTIFLLGFNAMSSLMQTLGYTVAVNELGPTYAARGLKVANPVQMKKNWAFIVARSKMMRDRMENYDRDTRDYIRRKGGFEALGVKDTAFFWTIGQMDRAMSAATWMGAYAKAMDGKMENIQPDEKGAIDEEAAIAYADSVVRMTQAAGSAKDNANVQRGTEAFKLWTMFYSSMSIMFNQFLLAGMRYQMDRNVGRLVGAAALLWLVPALMESVLRGDGPDDEDEESQIAHLAKKALWYPLGTVVGVRDLANALETGIDRGRAEQITSPAVEGLRVLLNAGIGIGTRGVSGDDDLSRHDWRNIVQTGGFILNVPTKQTWKTLEYFQAWQSGDQQPDHPLDVVRGVVSGIPRGR